MNIKEQIDCIHNEILKYRNTEVLSKFGEIKGLYAAYELSNSSVLLEKIIEVLLELIEMTINLPGSDYNTKKAIMNKENKTGELAGFYNYLVEKGKKPTTADCYRKTIMQIMKKFNILTIDEFNRKLVEIIAMYHENDKQNHNRHIAALLRYQEYLNNI